MDVVAKGAVAVRSTPVFMLLFAVASEKYAANPVGCCCSVLHMLLTCAVAVVLFTIAVNALAVLSCDCCCRRNDAAKMGTVCVV